MKILQQSLKIIWPTERSWLNNLGLVVSLEILLWVVDIVVGMFLLSIDGCLKPLIGRCRVTFDVTFILPDWIDRDMLVTVGGLLIGGNGRVIDGVRV